MTTLRHLPRNRSAAAGILIAIAILTAAIAPAQTPPSPAKTLTFEVVSVRPSGSPGKFPWNENPTPDGETWTNVSLQYLVREAYNVNDPKLWSGGPAWLDTQRFTIIAKFDPAAALRPTYEQRRTALMALLADRFQLKLHTESKDLPVFNLVVAKGGPKFQPSKPVDDPADAVPGSCHVLKQRSGMLQYQACSMVDLAGVLRFSTGRTVIDKTALSGPYDYELHWTPEDIPPAAAASFSGPSIFTAVQEQLGLKLEPATAPLQTFVIDSAELPTEN
jgi:uncharacterized protein (TIGR03435 family)